MRVCSQCQKSLPLSKFNRNCKSKDGYLRACRKCSKPSKKQIFYTHIKHAYGLSAKQWERLLIKQQGRCYICKDAPESRDLVVDHCHNTGRIRRLLCRQCNIAAGAVRDDPEIATALAKYLRMEQL